MKTYIRSSKLSTKFVNKNKQDELLTIYNEYKRLLQEFINYYYWNCDLNKLPKFCSPEDYNKMDSFLSSNLKQTAGKQALGIVRGTFQKQKQRIYKYEKLKEEGNFKEANNLKKVIDKTNISCPEVKNLEMEISSYIAKINFDNDTSFDGWVTLRSIYSNEYLKEHKGLKKIQIPLRRTRHFNRLMKKGQLKGSILISPKQITFRIEIEKKEKTEGKTLGIDIGLLNTISCSNGFQTGANNHGQTLDGICKKISKKKKGSKAYLKAQRHRQNFINWSINQLDLEGVSEVKRENIKNLRKFKRTSRLMGSWTYTEVLDKLDRYCEEQNVLVTKISPTFTSQRCSVCGWTRKSNRKGKLFKCTCCGFTADADLNASLNISFDLTPINYYDKVKKRHLFNNVKGFYWQIASSTS